MTRYVYVRTPDSDEELEIKGDEFWVTDKGELAIAGTMDDGETITVAQFASYTSAIIREVNDDEEYEGDDEEDEEDAVVRSPRERLAQLDAAPSSLSVAALVDDSDDEEAEVSLDVPEPSANGHVPVEAVRPAEEG